MQLYQTGGCQGAIWDVTQVSHQPLKARTSVKALDLGTRHRLITRLFVAVALNYSQREELALLQLTPRTESKN